MTLVAINPMAKSLLTRKFVLITYHYHSKSLPSKTQRRQADLARSNKLSYKQAQSMAMVLSKLKLKPRCPWLKLSNLDYVRYHDQEWGRPVHDDIKHFEMLTLEGAQAGLSWETILKKRARYREVFANFDPQKVARFASKTIDKLMLDPGIVRNRLKIESTASNARAFLAVQKDWGSFDGYIWSFVDHKPLHTRFKNLADYPAKTKLSDAISKDLKKRGFRFVGSTIVYAYMQAVGLSNDHSVGCFLHKKT